MAQPPTRGEPCDFVSGLKLAIQYSILWGVSWPPDMMTEIVLRFKPFEHCCMAILFVGSKGRRCPIQWVHHCCGKIYNFLPKGVIPCIFFAIFWAKLRGKKWLVNQLNARYIQQSTAWLVLFFLVLFLIHTTHCLESNTLNISDIYDTLLKESNTLNT